jgi:hypothetical protein
VSIELREAMDAEREESKARIARLEHALAMTKAQGEARPIGDDRALIAHALYSHARHIDQMLASPNEVLRNLYKGSEKDAERCRTLARQFAPGSIWEDAGSRQGGKPVFAAGFVPHTVKA